MVKQLSLHHEWFPHKACPALNYYDVETEKAICIGRFKFWDCFACFLIRSRYDRRVRPAELSLTPVPTAAVACKWVRRYYAYEGLPFNARVEAAVSQLLESSRFGWFFELTRNEEAIGYAVLTRAFDHEFGGEFGVLTDFFLLEQYRRHGHGSRALELIEEFARSQNLCALDLYVLERNAGVREFYKRRGFRDVSDRRAMTKSIADA